MNTASRLGTGEGVAQLAKGLCLEVRVPRGSNLRRRRHLLFRAVVRGNGTERWHRWIESEEILHVGVLI